MIHNILLLKKSGENLHSTYFGQESLNDTLTSGFISAAFSFTQTNFKAGIDEIEIGPFRLFFESGENFIITAFFDKADSIINVRQKLRKLREIITTTYHDVLEKDLCCSADYDGLDEVIGRVISTKEADYMNEKSLEEYTIILKKLRSNTEILDCDVISISTGLPLVHKWKEDFLNLCLGQIDAFWKSKNYMLDQIILSYEQRHLILFKIDENFILSVVIRKDTPLGLATLLIEDAAIKMQQL